jgi:hypothetical protein
MDSAIARFSAPPAEGEAKTHARAIGAALLERTKEVVDIRTWEAAALTPNLDEHGLDARPHPERDRGLGPCALGSESKKAFWVRFRPHVLIGTAPTGSGGPH